MGLLYENVQKEVTLYRAWRKVRESALTSSSREIRAEAKDFEAKITSQIRSLSARLSGRSFSFLPQKGVTKRRPGKEPRPIVVSPIPNRVVERAILDVVTTPSLSPTVANVLNSPFCIGGVRGVDAAVALIQQKLSTEGLWYLRSDIANFFTHIPREDAEAFIRENTGDSEFSDLFRHGLDTQLANPEEIREYLHLFPDEHLGVPQGCALSMLAGNIVLRDFDQLLNDRGLLCVRYVDDFLLIGRKKRHVQSAFASAQSLLQARSLYAYVPDGSSPKAEIGSCDTAFDFLGCEFAPGRVEPSKLSCSNIRERIDQLIEEGHRNITKARDGADGLRLDRRYYQTLAAIDRTLHGWANSYSFCNRRDRLASVDHKLDKRLARFKQRISEELRHCPPEVRRRALGVANASETPYRPPRHPEAASW